MRFSWEVQKNDTAKTGWSFVLWFVLFCCFSGSGSLLGPLPFTLPVDMTSLLSNEPNGYKCLLHTRECSSLSHTQPCHIRLLGYDYTFNLPWHLQSTILKLFPLSLFLFSSLFAPSCFRLFTLPFSQWTLLHSTDLDLALCDGLVRYDCHKQTFSPGEGTTILQDVS